MKDPLARLAHIASLNIAAVMARIERTEDHMRTICADGYPTGGEGGDGQLTAVEAATMARWKVERDQVDLMSALRRMSDYAGRAINICDQYPGVGHHHDTEVKRARCDGEMDPTCTDNAVARGKCMKCYQKARRRRA